ncbi:PREDICTED: small ubiquitin-related modifier 2-like [Galeopterus variegatus]|uniref:Small ubiquitin-related modifier 2-like n=1 Tax=Galeopterus variegatus TaxID=482537 RepID=A0ABM0SIV1_GALVR|nr:PREDICTED: small ubiquitin-related modifier 2-like [Galeopterus variegatus]
MAQTWYLFCKGPSEETLVFTVADEKPKEGDKTNNDDHINLKVPGPDGFVGQFKIKRSTPPSKVTKAYYERQELEMEAEDTIDVFQEQKGGIY